MLHFSKHASHFNLVKYNIRKTQATSWHATTLTTSPATDTILPLHKSINNFWKKLIQPQRKILPKKQMNCTSYPAYL
jgi:hypothetical protein